jgi:predicted O-linked N-acetylglucosamine transferase (SPINDLY family)
MFDVALQCHRAGDLRGAESLYQQILLADPKHPDALHLLGVVALQLGRGEVAVEYIEQALQLRPDHAEAHSNLGNALESLGRLEEAAAAQRQALRFRPDLAEIHGNLGKILRRQGKIEDAIACYRHALQLRPDFALAHNNLGNALKDLGELDQAVSCFRVALEFAPAYAEAHNNLGNALKEQGKLEEAIACYQHALQLQPNYPEAHCNLGTALYDLDRLQEALAALQAALRLRPDLAEAHLNLGNVLRGLGKLDEAVACYRYAAQLRPELAVAHNNLGNALKDSGQLDEAVACYRHAFRLRPDYSEAHSNLIYCLLYHPNYSATAILEEARHWHQLHAQPLTPSNAFHANDPNPERRLRVGYVSPDFREHPIGFILMPLLSNHDRHQVEIYCYSGVLRPDRVTERFRSYADVWRNTVGLADGSLAERIRADRIDVLIDLNLHIAGSRLLTFARRPAPVQLTWLGYPGTTGLSSMDYRLTDPHLDPPGETDIDYAERSIRLPESFWCYDPLGDGPEVSELPALRGEPFTFGCLNNFTKVNSASLRLWATVLRAVPGSRLLLLAPTGTSRNSVCASLRQDGVDSERILFVDRQARTEYLRTYHRIDLALDPLPYNGHNTSLDAAWMGVPTITLVGQTVVGRAGLSLLRNLRLPEFIAYNAAEYVTKAAVVASEIPRLARLRAGLREQMASSPLMDGPRFARGVEEAYRRMWQDWCGTRK